MSKNTAPLLKPGDLVTRKEAAEILGLTPHGIDQLRRKGILPAVTISGRWVRFRRDTLNNALKEDRAIPGRKIA